MKNNVTKRLMAMALCLCMLLSLYVPSVSADIEDYDALSFGQILMLQENLTWVVCGDSITHNGGWSQGTNSYGEWIEQYLRDIGRTDSVILTGVGGATLQDLQPDATSRNGIEVGTDQFITKFNPDVVTIKLGMNNRPQDEATFKSLYINMLDEVYAAAAKNGKVPKVVVITSTPVAGENNYDLDVPGQDSVNRQVGWLSSIAADYNANNGTHIEFVDLRNALTKERDVLGDEYYQTFFYGPSDGAIHPNAAGQYLMFKTIAKTLGFYDASMPIFNHDYADLNEGYMYVDSTYIADYTGDYGAENDGPDDAEEMDKTIPVLELSTQPELIASIDFTDKNGSFVGGDNYAGATRIDMTDAEVMDDALTLAEAQALGTEYSVVLRARLDPSNNRNQPVLFVSANGDDGWGDAIALGVQGKDDQIYYEIRSAGKDITNSSNTMKIDANKTMVNGGWHTIVIVQSGEDLRYYVDGALVGTQAVKVNDGKTIGSVFANAENFVAHIGSYSKNAGSYELDGDLDYYQLYNGALSAEEVAYLTAADGVKLVDADEMNSTMPTLDGVSTVASIEFTNSTGSFDGANTNLVDLTDATVAADPITFAEAQALGKSFSVVLRGRLEQGTNANAGILLISDNGVAKWNDALTVGIPSQKNQGWLRLMDGGDQKVSPNGQYNFTGVTPSGDGEWHTLVITVSENAYTYYLDGGLVDTRALTFTSTIGEVMTSEASFAARFGRYSDGDGGSYTLKGVLDYFQFYGQTLTAEQAVQLSVNNAEEMNAAMPTLPEAEKAVNVLASVDFGSGNGKFGGDSGELRYVDLMNDEVVADKLTAEEVKSMGKEYTIVFRARVEDSDFDFANHNVTLYMSDNKDAGWGPANTLMVGFPGKHSKNIWYGEKALTSVSGTVAVESLRAAVMDGQWHTFAIVQAEDGMTMYVDGANYSVSTNWYLQQELGTYFANAVDNGTFEAIFGSYGSGSNADAGYGFDGWVDYVQLYDGVLSANNIAALADANAAEVDPNAAQWSDIDTANSNWAIAAGTQMIGYQGSVGNRSLLRLIENTARNGSSWDNRDIHIIPFASKGYDPEYLVSNYDTIFGGHYYDVFMLLPEVPDVYAAGYVHSEELVASYKEDILTLMAKNSDKVKVLWSPLASNNDTINAYISDYAEAVRQIASGDNTVLFFDSNKFMNERMAANASLKTNWFEEGMNISPLCSIDVVSAFYAHANVSALLVSQEMKNHNLRLSSDNRSLKDCVRDYIVPGVTVSGSSITVDASNILAAYPGLTNLRVAVLSATGVGSNHDGNWEDIAYFGSGSSVTFTAPWSNAVVTVIGDMNGYSYRFKDVSTNVAAATQTVEHYTDGLTGLEVVGAPAIGFSADKTSYSVELYQYQRNVQIRAEGGDNLSITVNGKAVEAGALSQQIAVDSTATVTVKVTGGDADKTYTLNLTRPDSADIIITEVMQSTSGALYDMVEIYNASGEELNLLDFALGYKKDYTDSVYTTQNKGQYPYYFTGDDQAFNSRNASTQTYTGINQITKNSTFWSEENAVEEPDYIPFPADSTMVLWVKYNGASATYETLISTLENSATTYTLEDGTKIVPNADIIALAERPNGITTNGAVQTGYGVLPPEVTNFYLDDFNTLTRSGGDDNSSRGWIFILKDTAVRDDNISITEAGDDIISASMLVRPTNSVDMSTVLYYDTDRGMAVARNPVSFNATETGAPYYSSEYSYANYTTFGAVEYWQKPYDLADTTLAVIDNQTPAGVMSGDDAQIKLDITDNEDIRYLELYVDADNDGTYETVIKKDITLITSATNEGEAKDITSYTQTFDLTDLTNTVNYYGFVLDGNNNKTELGNAANPKVIEIVEPGQLKINASVLDEAGNASAEKITVTITLNKGDALVNFAGNYVVYNAEDESVGTVTNGTGTLTVGNGDSLIVKNLPEGTGYTLTVTVPEGYEDLTETEDLTGKIGTDGITSVAAKKTLATTDLTVSTSVKKADGTTAGETAATVVIAITKGTSPVELAESYVVVDGSGNKLGETKDGTVTVSLADGQKAIVQGLPVGAAYSVATTAPEGYEDVTTGGVTGAVTANGGSVSLAFEEILVTGDLTVGASVKKVDGTASTEKVTVKIELTKGNASIAPDGSYEVVDAEGNKLGTVTNGTVTVELADGQKAIVKGLPTGTAYALIVTAPEGYEDITDSAVTGNVTETGAIAAVAVKEELVTGGLTVNAVVKKVNGSASAEKVTVKIQITKGDAPVDLESGYTVVDGSGNVLGTTANGTITVTLGDGDKAVIADLPEGAAYTLTVTAPEGYADESTDATTGTISANGASVTVVMKEELVTGDLTVNVTAEKVDGTASTEKVTVKIDLTQGDAPLDLEESYDIVDSTGAKLGTVTNGTATVELTDGQKAIVKNVAVGAAYTVTVTAPEGYENTTEGATGGNVAESGSSVSVSVKEKLVTGSLTVKMDLNDCTGADADSSVKATVKIKLTQGDAPVALAESYDILNGKGVKIGTLVNGEATVTLTNGDTAVISGLPAGAAYTVTVTAPEGYEDITDGATTGNVAASGSNVTVAVQEQVKEGQLYVSASVKKVDGTASTAKAAVVITLTKANSPVDLAESYDILDENGNKIGTVTNGTATLSLSDGDKAVISGLPEGAGYNVKVTAPTGYEDKTDAAVTTGIIGTDSGAVACEVAEILKTGEVTVTAELKTHDGETVTDEEVTVTVTLSKGLSPVELAESYDIVNENGEKIGSVVNGVATFKLASGEKATIKGLPQGTAYMVSLTAPEGYENTTTGATSGNVSDTAGLVSLSITEKAPEESTEDPSEETKPKPPVVNPDTGDASGMGVWMTVMAASAALLCLMAVAFAALDRKSKNRR